MKKTGQIWRKRLFSETFFTSVLTIARESQNPREKSWQDGSVNLFENVTTTITETMTQKSAIDLVETSSNIFNSTFKTSQYP